MKTRFPDLSLDLTFHPVHCPNPCRFTPAQIEQFNCEGYVAGIEIFKGEELKKIQAFFEQAKHKLISFPKLRKMHHTFPELYDIVTNPLLVGYLQDLLGSNVVCFISQYVCKEPGDFQEVGWHQDAWFNPMDARSVVVWLAVYDADVENGCMWFVPGSHLQGAVDHKNGRIGDGTFSRNSALRPEDEQRKIPIPLKAGQVVFFSDLLLHGSPANLSPRQRGGYTMTFTCAENRPYKGWHEAGVLCCGKDLAGNWGRQPHPRG